MKLRGRDAIKPPKRYEEEMFKKRTPQPSVQSQLNGYNPVVGRLAIKSAIVGFNPDLPPAAFPTIDGQQSPKLPTQEVPESFSNMAGRIQEFSGVAGIGRQNIAEGHYNMASSNQEQGMTGDGDVFMIDSGYDFGSSNALEELDYEACQRDINYLEELWNSAHGARSSMNLSDDENVVGIGAYEAAGMATSPLRRVKWSDISPILQTEIFENLRSVYDYRQAVEALKLNPSEQVKMIEHSSARKEQIQLENAKLNEMRIKQLRALLRVDNSYLRTQKVPGQLVFRNISKKCLRDTTTNSGPDYSMSQASDILIARKYLRSIGLDPNFAGEWSNNLVTITTTGMTGAYEDFEWTGELLMPEEADISENDDTESYSSPSSETRPDDSSRSDCSPTPKRLRTCVPNLSAAQRILGHRHRRESSVSRTGTIPSLPFRDLRNSARSTHSVQSSRPFQEDITQPAPLSRESVIRLNVGPQRAARIQQDIFGEAGNNMRALSQRQTNFSSNNTSSSNHQTPPLGIFKTMPSLDGTKIPCQEIPCQLESHQPGPGMNGGCEALKRSLGGAWCYSRSREETEAASRASRAFRDRLVTAGAEVPQADSACPGSNPTSSFVNLTMPSPDNKYDISNIGLSECQFEGPRVESLVGWACSPAEYSEFTETIPTLGKNFVPYYGSPSNHEETERYGPQYSPITPPSISAPCSREEYQTDTSGFAGHEKYPTDNNIGLPLLDMVSLPRLDDVARPNDVIAASCSLSTTTASEKVLVFSTQVSANSMKNPISPVPELEMASVSAESAVMETDIALDKYGPASTETAAPPTPNMDTVLVCHKTQIPDSSNGELSTPLGLERLEKPMRKKYRKSRNSWTTKRRKASNKAVQSLAETTGQGSAKKETKNSVPSFKESGGGRGRRRSERINNNNNK
ncbi:hypothetical protein ACJ72_03556 [Emergomyces africanus]|uniref:Uncharacterized protein n=1 Tax=Emergomyces africanus TaxID=1955775 RepID=A0A1B7NZB3_9EURO|nr:hypothetical protein ACJ72_03556 [Emergomyces africanus]